MGLTTQGYQILEAPTGKAALALLRQAPDLVILDLGLSDIADTSCCERRTTSEDSIEQSGGCAARAQITLYWSP
jgi:two-component system KDP operon response regulator KdpE